MFLAIYVVLVQEYRHETLRAEEQRRPTAR